MGRLAIRRPVTKELHPNSWTRPSSGPESREFRITSPFGWRDDPLNPGQRVFHGGLDIGNGRLGDPVVAVADGKVIASGRLLQPWSSPAPSDKVSTWGVNYGGLMVIMRHDGGVVSIFAHLRSIAVNTGARIAKGTKVGEIGDTGSAYRAGHLHFGVQVDDRDIDPEPLVLEGKTIAIGDDMQLVRGGVDIVVNRDCEIRAGTNYRSEADHTDPTNILGITDDTPDHWRPVLQVNQGSEVNGSSVWYGGFKYLRTPEGKGRGWALVFVHSSRITGLMPEERLGSEEDQRSIRKKDRALDEIISIASEGRNA